MKAKRAWIGIVLLVISAACLFCSRTGGRRSDVCLRDFSQTGDTVMIRVDVLSSAGYVRTCKPRMTGSGDLCLGFYSTYGINSRWGAEDTFTLEPPEDCGSIFFERADGVPYIVLVRDAETGAWRAWDGA